LALVQPIGRSLLLSHPKQQNMEVQIHDKNHPSTTMLPDRWKRFDELYNYKSIVMGIKVLGTLDETTYSGGKNGVNHPFILYREFDGGRSFYTGGGHTDESFVEPLFVQHLLEELSTL
jgi:type 1 glutamine amidotransferase